MNCIVVDDEKTARSIIGHLGGNNPNIEIQESFRSAIKAIKYLNEYTIDLVFLDIHMPLFTGIDFIKTLKDPPQIILTTSDKSFALEAFEYECIIDYFIKPITQERFDKGVEKAISANQNAVVTYDSPVPDESLDDLYINIDRRLVKIDIPTINIVEAKGDYILLKTTDKNYMVHSTLKKIENKLPQDYFLKVHRSYIINTRKIIDIEDNSVLIGKDVVPVSRSNKAELMRSLNLL
ncbi:MAG: LytTR family DNA-binding domain-containing protein [Eudoraea sp.]|nr:LytTR family DNA-binding domain-containing protein [Eudoraea sp.]